MAFTTKGQNFTVNQQSEYLGGPSDRNGDAAGGAAPSKPGVCFHNQKLIASNYPNSPIHNGELTPAERAEALEGLVLNYNGAGSHYGTFFQDGVTPFGHNYSANIDVAGPNIDAVAEKINPYMPDQSLGNNPEHKSIINPPHESLGHGEPARGMKVHEGLYPSITSVKSGQYNPLDPVSADGFDGQVNIENI